MVAVGLGLLLYFTPIMSARNVVITGLGAVHPGGGRAAAAVAPGTPLLQINTDAVAERVATIRRVASARVQREYPSTLRITVVERVPVVVKDYPDGPHLFDRDGVDFATAPPPPGLPYLDADNPGPSDPPTKAALQVMTALRPEVAGQVGRIAAPSVAVDHPDLVRRPGGGLGDHRPHRGEGAQAGGAAHPAGPDLRRLQPGFADRQVGPGIHADAEITEIARRRRRRACTDTPRRRPTVLFARNYLT